MKHEERVRSSAEYRTNAEQSIAVAATKSTAQSAELEELRGIGRH